MRENKSSSENEKHFIVNFKNMALSKKHFILEGNKIRHNFQSISKKPNIKIINDSEKHSVISKSKYNSYSF